MIITMNELSKIYAAKLLETGSHDQAMLHVWWVAYNTDRPEGWAKKQFFTEQYDAQNMSMDYRLAFQI